MFRTIHALVLVAGLVVLVGHSFGQDPVTERPGNSQPMSVPVAQEQTPAAAPKLLMTLEGREEGLFAGPLAFYLYDTNQVMMVDAAKKPVQGSFKREGDRIQLTFGNCVYDGTAAKNGPFAGIARVTKGPNTGKSWTFSVAPRVSLVGRFFGGKENLPGYGDVVFRFVDGKTVEMTDRDGVTRGTYTQNGAQVSLTFGTAVYTGEFRDNAIVGSARNHNANWTFEVNASK